MKIIKENKVYIQLSDVFNLNQIITLLNLKCPISVTRKCFNDNIVIDGDNRDCFLEFTDKEAIIFFKKIDCIVDYYDLRTKNEEELMNMIKKLHQEVTIMTDKYNHMSHNNQNKNYRKYQKDYYLKSYKAHSINSFLAYLKGEKDLPLPNDIKPLETKKEEKSKTFIKTNTELF